MRRADGVRGFARSTQTEVNEAPNMHARNALGTIEKVQPNERLAAADGYFPNRPAGGVIKRLVLPDERAW